MTIEILKNDERSLQSQLAQIQGALAYNKQLQTFLEEKDRKEKQDSVSATEKPNGFQTESQSNNQPEQ
jgi:hypothetical protein